VSGPTTDACDWPRPCQARVVAVSVTATAGDPSSRARWRTQRSAEASASPVRSSLVIWVAVCKVRKVARSASVPR
jgi:hypothetical protein